MLHLNNYIPRLDISSVAPPDVFTCLQEFFANFPERSELPAFMDSELAAFDRRIQRLPDARSAMFIAAMERRKFVLCKLVPEILYRDLGVEDPDSLSRYTEIFTHAIHSLYSTSIEALLKQLLNRMVTLTPRELSRLSSEDRSSLEGTAQLAVRHFLYGIPKHGLIVLGADFVPLQERPDLPDAMLGA